MPDEGVYDFQGKKVYCFSDLEGYIPDISGIQKDTSSSLKFSPINPTLSRVVEILNNKTTLDTSKEAIIFTGDAVDNGPQSIQLLQNLLDLKTKNMNNVILCAGNRDVNKLRFADELYIVTTVDDLPWTKFSENLSSLLEDYIKNESNYKFKWNADILKWMFQNTNEPTWKTFTDTNYNEIFSQSIPDRVKNIYSRTMGAADYPLHYWKKEGERLFNDIFPTEEKKQLFLLAILNMVMSRVWKDSDIPVYLKSYNGLYVNYLKNTHVIASFKQGTDRYGFASHSGIPIKDGLFQLPQGLGYYTNTNGSILENMIALNSNVKKVYELFNNDNTGLIRNNDVINLFRMTANVGLIENKNSTRNSALSPIVSMSKIIDKGPKAIVKKGIKKYKPSSNSSEEQNVSVAANSNTTENDSKRLKPSNGGETMFRTTMLGASKRENGISPPVEKTFFNIFGHQPAGYVPEAATYTNGNTTVYHIDLDVSRADANRKNGNECMALLVLGNPQSSSTDIMGVFKAGDKKYIYNHTLSDYASFEKGVDVWKVPGSESKLSNTSISNTSTYMSGFDKILLSKEDVQKITIPNKINKTKKYIISTGDISDFDGFLSLALYKKKAELIGNTDVVFIMNYPAYFSHTDSNTANMNKDKDVQAFGRNLPGKGYNYSAKSLFVVNTIKDGILNKLGSEYKAAMRKLAFNMCKVIWQDLQRTIPGTSKLIFVEGGVNEVNPFSMDTIKNEFNVYAPVFGESYKFEEPTNTNNIIKYYNSTSDFYQSLPKDNCEIYMDMNGSMAFYDSKEFSQVIDKLKSVTIMGGVLENEMVNTMSTTPFLNRFSSATMNQLYAPSKTLAFLNDLENKKIPTLIVSNNEINKNFMYGDNIEDFIAKLKEFKLLPNEGNSTMEKLCRAYYELKNVKPFRPFDVLSSFVLVDSLNGRLKPSIQKRSMLFLKEYGSTIIAADTNKADTNKYKAEIITGFTYYRNSAVGGLLKKIYSSDGNGFALPGLQDEHITLTNYMLNDENSKLVPVYNVTFPNKEVIETAIKEFMKSTQTGGKTKLKKCKKK